MSVDAVGLVHSYEQAVNLADDYKSKLDVFVAQAVGLQDKTLVSAAVDNLVLYMTEQQLDINSPFIDFNSKLLTRVTLKKNTNAALFRQTEVELKDTAAFVCTPLYLAAKFGALELVHALIAAGADPNKAFAACANLNRTVPYSYIVEHALVPICVSKNVGLLRIFLDSGANPNPRMGFTHSSSSFEAFIHDIYRNVKAEHQDLNSLVFGVDPVFSVCAKLQWEEGLSMLLDAGLPVSATAWEGRLSLLSVAMQYDLSDAIIDRVSIAQDPTIITPCGQTIPLLAHAVLYKHVHTVKHLIARGKAPVNWVGVKGYAVPFLLARAPPGCIFPDALAAAEADAITICDMLLEQGMEINTHVAEETALSRAFLTGWEKLAMHLLSRGADMYGQGASRDLVYLTVTMANKSAFARVLRAGYDHTRLTFLPSRNGEGAGSDPAYPHLLSFLLQQMPRIEQSADILAVRMVGKAIKNGVSPNSDVSLLPGADAESSQGISLFHLAVEGLWDRLHLFTPLAQMLLHEKYGFNLNLHSTRALAAALERVAALVIAKYAAQDAAEALDVTECKEETVSFASLSAKAQKAVVDTLATLLRPLRNSGYDFSSCDVRGDEYVSVQMQSEHSEVFALVFAELDITVDKTVDVNADKPLQGYRSQIFFAIADPRMVGVDGSYKHYHDGLLVVQNGKVKAVGNYAELRLKYPSIPVQEYKHCVLMPGFIDTHIHFPQMGVLGSYGAQLLDWLKRYTFPNEMRFADADYAHAQAHRFIRELLRNGTTTALVFCSVHPQSVDAFFTEAERLNLRMIAGKVLMDRNCPPELQDTAESGYKDSKDLIERWHNKKRLLYAVTPRFAPTSTPEQLDAAARLLQEHDGLYMHTHISENKDEVAWVLDLFPKRKTYLDVYDHHQLLGPRAVFAHGVHLNGEDCDRLSETGSAVSFCPTSNLFLGSGLFDMKTLDEKGVRVGLGTDVGGGTHFCHLATLNEAYKVLQLQKQSLGAFRGFYLATLGSARALYLDDKIGSLEVGKEADFVVLDLAATELIQYRLGMSEDLYEILFALMMLGDDRCVKQTYAAGACVYDNEQDQYVPQQ